MMIEVAQFQPPNAQARYVEWRKQHADALSEIPPEALRIDTGRAADGGTFVSVRAEQEHASALLPSHGLLVRYWIEFDWPKRDGIAFGTEDHGFGVTAFDLDDALSLIRQEFFAHFQAVGRPKAEPPVRRVIESVDVSILPDHVRTGMHPPNWRGVWFPPMKPLS